MEEDSRHGKRPLNLGGKDKKELMTDNMQIKTKSQIKHQTSELKEKLFININLTISDYTRK
jgi:hypothetical protein